MNEYERKLETLIEAENAFVSMGGDTASSDYVKLKRQIRRAEAEVYLEDEIPGQWDEENVRMTLRRWALEQSVMNHLEGNGP